MKQIQLSVEAVQELSQFVLEEILDGPITWSTLSEKFLEQRSLENDDQFRWLFSRLISRMLEELWIVKISDEDLFEVGITFKGRTVLRHTREISGLFDRHFKNAIETANQAAETKQKKRQDRAKKEQTAIKKSDRTSKRKQNSAKKRKKDLASRSKPTLVKKSKIYTESSIPRILAG